MKMDAIIIGGGIAGLQAAIQLGRYMHAVTIVDNGYGRSVLCRSYRNLLGWPDGVSGLTLRTIGRLQAEGLGVIFIEDEVMSVEHREGIFLATLRHRQQPLQGSLVLLATGVMDRFTPLPGLVECFGLSVYVCPDCDGFEVRDRNTIVMGSGDVGAHMALALAYWTNRITFVNHELKPISDNVKSQLTEQGISTINEEIRKVVTVGIGQFAGVELTSGEHIQGERAFIAFGGNEVRSELAHQLGAERLENGHIVTDPRTKMTSVPNLWAAGDIGIHSEMLSVAMAEGTLSAVWMHKALVHMGRKGMSTIGANS
ncbi:MAG: NAD(P)/FAD-dependent oxidoreductase [Paenibacillaceae bacterium]